MANGFPEIQVHGCQVCIAHSGVSRRCVLFLLGQRTNRYGCSIQFIDGILYMFNMYIKNSIYTVHSTLHSTRLHDTFKPTEPNSLICLFRRFVLRLRSFALRNGATVGAKQPRPWAGFQQFHVFQCFMWGRASPIISHSHQISNYYPLDIARLHTVLQQTDSTEFIWSLNIGHWWNDDMYGYLSGLTGLD